MNSGATIVLSHISHLAIRDVVTKVVNNVDFFLLYVSVVFSLVPDICDLFCH